MVLLYFLDSCGPFSLVRVNTKLGCCSHRSWHMQPWGWVSLPEKLQDCKQWQGFPAPLHRWSPSSGSCGHSILSLVHGIFCMDGYFPESHLLHSPVHICTVPIFLEEIEIGKRSPRTLTHSSPVFLLFFHCQTWPTVAISIYCNLEFFKFIGEEE